MNENTQITKEKKIHNNNYLLLDLKGVLMQSFDAIISIHDINFKVLSSSSNYIVDVVMWQNFDWFIVFMREGIITQILYGFEQKKRGGLGSSSIIWEWY